jgi:hypothetical protein
MLPIRLGFARFHGDTFVAHRPFQPGFTSTRIQISIITIWILAILKSDVIKVASGDSNVPGT